MAEFFDAAGSLAAFCSESTQPESEVATFIHTIVRLFSLLNASALEHLTDTVALREVGFETIDAMGLDSDTSYVLESPFGKRNKSMLLFQWIQCLMVKGLAQGIIAVPAPICARAFQNLADGMAKFHDAQKVAKIPFPFPYVGGFQMGLASNAV